MTDHYIALDIETTGLHPASDSILEIGALKVEDGAVVDTFEGFVRPKDPVPPFITHLTGITDEMVQGAPDISEVLARFAEFANGACLLGHNIGFDYSFLKYRAAEEGQIFEKQLIDTLLISKQAHPGLPKKTLEAMCDYYGIERVQKHRASDDARAAHLLYKCLKNAFGDGNPAWFRPKDTGIKIKKDTTITNAQKRYLNDLMKYHRIVTETNVEALTRSEASRFIDEIISGYGRIKR